MVREIKILLNVNTSIQYMENLILQRPAIRCVKFSRKKCDKML
jgi:hypothetical protein